LRLETSRISFLLALPSAAHFLLDQAGKVTE